MRLVPRTGGGDLGDELFGEIEMEVGDAHWFDFSGVSERSGNAETISSSLR